MTEPAILADWMERHLWVEEITGHNDHPLIKQWLRGDAGLEWCAAAVLQGIRQCGLPKPPGDDVKFGLWGWYYPNRKALTFAKNMKKVGLVKGPRCIPNRGDLVFWKHSHVDVVLDADEEQWEVIGGNVKNKMAARTIRHAHSGVLCTAEVREWK